MRSALAAFERSVRDLRWFIESLDFERAALSTLNASDVVDGDPSNSLKKWSAHLTHGILKRQFDYNAIIITLYGLLEQHVENLIVGYTRHLNAVVPLFSDIPDAVRSSHLELSLSLLSTLRQSRYKGNATEASVISNLHACTQGITPYQLNHDAFIQHTANFRINYINEIFNRIGLTGVAQRVSAYSPLSAYLGTKFHGREITSIPASETFFLLDDLVERRNEVAHGGATQLLSFEMLRDYVDFIEAFGQALYNLVLSAGIQISGKHRGIDLGHPINVFNHSIVCLEMRNAQIKVGDTLIALTEQSLCPLLHGEIIELQVNSMPVEMVPAQAGINVGIKIPFRTSVKHKFILLSK